MKHTTLILFWAATLSAADSSPTLTAEQRERIRAGQLASERARAALMDLHQDPEYVKRLAKLHEATAAMQSILAEVRKEAKIADKCRIGEDLAVTCEEAKK